MYNFKQLKILLKLSFSSLCCLIALSIIIHISGIFLPSFLWVPKQYFGIDFVKENHQRVAGAKAYYRKLNNNKNNPLIAILGLSSASEGISVAQLQQHAQANHDNNTRFLSLSGAGRNIREVEIYNRPLIRSTLEPAMVVLAINPFHLIDTPKEHTTVRHAITNMPNLYSLINALAKRRNDFRHLVEMKVFRFRSNLFSIFNNRVDEQRLDPWRETRLMNILPLQSPTEWLSKLNEYGSRGYYEIANYKNSHQQINALAHIIQQFSERNTEVIIVWMPEHSSLYKRVPQEAAPLMLERLKHALAEHHMPPIIDMRQAVNDEGFNDISHMNAIGRELFTQSLYTVIPQ